MTREEQDKLWNELSEEQKQIYKEKYKIYSAEPFTDDFGGRLDVMEDLLGRHNLQPKLTYEDIVNHLFEDGYCYYDYMYGRIEENSCTPTMPMACTSQNQVRKLCAINQLLNIAKFLNKNEDGTDWVPDYEGIEDFDETFYGIGIDPDDKEVIVFQVNPERLQTEMVYFRTEALGKQAIEILGEETIRMALGNY